MKGILIGGLAIAMLVIMIIGIGKSFEPTFNEKDYTVKSYYVESGNSLYGLATKYCKSDDRIDEWIEAVKHLNCMTTSTIYANSRIKIYVPAE